MKPFQQISRYLAVFMWALLMGGGLTGCSPKNPLDRTVDASDLGTFSDWWKHERRSLPNGLRAEVDDAFKVISNSTIRRHAPDLNSSNDPFCVQVNGLRLRDILIDAYFQKNQFLLKRISLGTENLESLTKNTSFDSDPKIAERRVEVIKEQKEIITNWKAEFENNEARIAELKGPAPR